QVAMWTMTFRRFVMSTGAFAKGRIIGRGLTGQMHCCVIDRFRCGKIVAGINGKPLERNWSRCQQM
ncbi:MAG: hypothetical protein ACRD8U_10780, partial [Pyrinomonadaceae bacterium]